MARILKQGSRGEDVRALQQFLADQGYDVGKVDGDFGRRTAAAVRAFQRASGLNADGEVGTQTAAAMQMPPVPRERPGTVRPTLMATDRMPSGMVEMGNINLDARPRVPNPDGSISTVRSMSIGEDGREVLIPTVSPWGTIVPDRTAVELYRRTGQNLGKFDNSANADAYAQMLHEQQRARYAQVPPLSGLGMRSQPSPMSLPQRSGLGMPSRVAPQPPTGGGAVPPASAAAPDAAAQPPRVPWWWQPYAEAWTGKSTDQINADLRDKDVSSGNSPLAGADSYNPDARSMAAEAMARGIVENLGGGASLGDVPAGNDRGAPAPMADRFNAAFGAPEEAAVIPPETVQDGPPWWQRGLGTAAAETWRRIHDPDVRRRMERDGLTPPRRPPPQDPLLRALSGAKN